MQIEINLREHSATDVNYLVTSTYLLILFSHYSFLLYLLNSSPLPHVYTEALFSFFKKRLRRKRSVLHIQFVFLTFVSQKLKDREGSDWWKRQTEILLASSHKAWWAKVMDAASLGREGLLLGPFPEAKTPVTLPAPQLPTLISPSHKDWDTGSLKSKLCDSNLKRSISVFWVV